MRLLLAFILCVFPVLAQFQQHSITTNKIVISNGITNDANNLRININPGPGITLTTNNTQITFSAAGAGLGDVTGPAAAVDEDIAVFDGASGKIIKDSGVLISDLALSGHTHVQLHNRGHSVVDVLDHTDWPATVSLTELGYLDGVTSALQTQLDAKQPASANLTNWSAIATSAKQNYDYDLESISAIGGSVGQLIQHDGTRWTNTTANPFQGTNANLTALSAYGPTTWQATNANLTALADNDGSSLTNMLGATNAYQLVNLAQLQAAIPSDRVAYFTESFASGFTTTGTVGLTNYADPANPATAWTNSAATWADGTYVAMFITTNTYTSFSSGLISVDVYCYENSAGSGSIAAEVYVMNSVSKIEEYEFTPAPAFQAVPATSTPTKLTFSVPVSDYTSTTNLHLAVKIKVSESSTPDPKIRIVGGGAYASHLMFAIPGSSYLTKSEALALYQPLDADLTSWAGVTRAAGFDAFATTPSSANLRTAVTDENGTGALLFDGASSLTMGTASFTAITNSALTAGRVIFSGTTKDQADDADLTFSTDTLTATKVSAPTAVYTGSFIATNYLYTSSPTNLQAIGLLSLHGLTVTNLTASQAVVTDASKNLASVAYTGSGNVMRTRTGVAREIWIPASAMNPAGSSAAAFSTNTWATTTDAQVIECYDFDDSTDESVQIVLTMPINWDGSDPKVKFFWKPVAELDAYTNIWGAVGGSINNDEDGGNTLGTAATVEDVGLTSTNKLHVSPALTIDIGGSPSAGHMTWFKFYRDANAALDELVGDARLIGVMLQYIESSTEPTAW